LAARKVPEVGICFGDHWLRGVAADKLSVHRYEAFETPNLPPLAELGLHIQIHPHAGVFPRQVPPGIGRALESSLAVYSPFPGMRWTLPDGHIRGVLIQAFGAGNLPIALLDSCREQGIPVVVTSCCPWGGVDLATYELGRMAADRGAIPGGLHTRWAALAKMGLVLGAGGSATDVRKAFGISWAGEPM
jgi:L-asparaginase